MAQKYVMYGFNFHPEVREFITPKVYDTFSDAVDAMRQEWENYQNEYILDTWFDGFSDIEDEDEEVAQEIEEDYRSLNYVEEFGNTAKAVSEGGGEFTEPQYLRVEPLNCKHAVLVAIDPEFEVRIAYENDSIDEIRTMIVQAIIETTADMKLPMAWAFDGCLHVWENDGDEPMDDRYYMLIEA